MVVRRRGYSILFGSEISKGQRNAETRHSSCARTASQGRRLEDVPCKSGKTRDHWAITSLKASRKNFKWAEASGGRLAFPRVGRELPVGQMPHEHGRQGPVGAIFSRRLHVERFSRRESCPKISFDGILIWKSNLGIASTFSWIWTLETQLAFFETR